MARLLGGFLESCGAFDDCGDRCLVLGCHLDEMEQAQSEPSLESTELRVGFEAEEASIPIFDT